MAIKRFPYIEDIHVRNAADKLLYCRFGHDPIVQGSVAVEEIILPDGKAHKLNPAMITHYEFLVERVNDLSYVELEPKLKVFEAGGRQHTLRHQLRIQKEDAKARGYWELRDKPDYRDAEDDYKRLQHAVTNPKGNLSLDQIEFNYFPYGQAVCNVTTLTLEDAERGLDELEAATAVPPK